MITTEAKEIRNRILSELAEEGITDSKHRIMAAKVVANSLMRMSNDSVYQFVINSLNEMLN
jgi:hypothetical protein